MARNQVLLLVVALASLLAVARCRPAAFVVVQSTSTQICSFHLLNLVEGLFEHKSDLAVKVQPPLVETTYDAVKKEFFAVSYSASGALPNLYKFSNPELNVTESWTQLASSPTYFDLQFSEKDQSLYGIVVTGSTTRSLAHFILGKNSLKATPIGALPDGWYVNASSFYQVDNTYFALLNQFPSLPNATVNQKLLIASDLSPIKKAALQIYDIPPVDETGVLLTGIAFSRPMNALYGVGWWLANQTTAVVRFGSQSASFTPQWWSLQPPGPLIADDYAQNLYCFSNNPSPAGFSVVEFVLYNSPGESGIIKSNFPGAYECAAATFYESVSTLPPPN